MDASHLFTAALRLRSPWRVGSADFRDADGDGREPLITIGFEPGRGFMLLFEAWVWLYRLCSWMMHSRLEPMKDFARMIRRHFAEIVAYFEHPYTNAVLKGADSVIQNVKRRARGFRNMDYFATMIYLTCGRLDLKAVTTT